MIELFYDKSDGEFVVTLFRKSICIVNAWEMMNIEKMEFSPFHKPNDYLLLFELVGDFSSFEELREFFVNKYPELMI